MTSKQDIDYLMAAAREAMAHAHAPYSHYAVGAALLLTDGQVIDGANMENASYGMTLCAETVALGTANSQGDLRNIVAIAIVGGRMTDTGVQGKDVCRPCGRCRQMLHEAASLGRRDITVYCSAADGGEIETHNLSDLLPLAFGPADLGL